MITGVAATTRSHGKEQEHSHCLTDHQLMTLNSSFGELIISTAKMFRAPLATVANCHLCKTMTAPSGETAVMSSPRDIVLAKKAEERQKESNT